MQRMRQGASSKPHFVSKKALFKVETSGQHLSFNIFR